MATSEPGVRERVRVAHVITQLELGGAQENTLHTVKNLDRERHDVTLICGAGGMLDDEARGIPDLDLHFIDSLVRPVAPVADGRALIELMRLFRRQRPTIVHTHSSKAGILGRLAARLTGVPVVIHSIHGFGFTPAQAPALRRAFLWAERGVGRFTTHFVAVSRSNLTEGLRLGLFRRDAITLIRSGFSVARFATAPSDRVGVRRELGFDEGAPVVGTVSCLKPQKDPLSWAETAAEVLKVEPRARFWLAGDGVLEPALRQRLASLGIEGQVRLLGWRRDIPRLLRASDLLLHTSRWEGLPKVIPQAMAAGLPVVCTAVDGAPEAIREGEAGILAQPGDATALAAGVFRLLRDPALAARFAARGRQLVDEFDERHLVVEQERLYAQLLQPPGGPQGSIDRAAHREVVH